MEPNDDRLQEVYEALDEATTKEETEDAIEAALKLAIKATPNIREEIVEECYQESEYNKTTLKDWMDTLSDEVTLDKFSIVEIEKIIPDSEEDDGRFRFHIRMNGDEEEFTLENNQIYTQKHFVQALFWHFEERIEFDDWPRFLNYVMDQAEPRIEDESPTSPEHAAAENVLDEMETLELTTDKETFRRYPERTLYLDESETPTEVHLSNKVADKQRQSMKGSMSSQKLRDIMSPWMVNGRSKKLRRGDGYFLRWRFNLQALIDAGRLDPEDVEAARQDDADPDPQLNL